MGSAHSSNFSQQAQSAVASVSTNISQAAASKGLAQNSVTQLCDDIKITTSGRCKANVCNMTDIAQGNTSLTMQETLQKAVLNNTTSQSMKQGLEAAAESVVKGFAFGMYSNAQNVSQQTMSASSKINNQIKQECVTDNVAVNSILQSCQRATIQAQNSGAVDECGVEACNMSGVRQQNLVSNMQKCVQDSNVTNKVLQDLEQRAKMTAVAKAEGFDLLGELGRLAVLIGVALVLLYAVSVYGFNSFVESARKIRVGSILIVVGFVLLLSGGGVGVSQAERWTKKGLMRPQMFASANIDPTAFPTSMKMFCADGDNACQDQTAPSWKRMQSYCADESKKDDPEYSLFCRNNGKPWNTTAVVGVPYRKLGDDGVGITMNQLNTLCQKDKNCVGWRWNALEGPMGVVFKPLKQRSPGFLGFFAGEQNDKCDRQKCMAMGQDSDECQRCCPAAACGGQTPCNSIIFDPCSQHQTEAECNGSSVYPLWDERDTTYGGCSIKCAWSKPIDEFGREKASGTQACRKVNCNTKKNGVKDVTDDRNNWSARACFDAKCSRFGCQYCEDREQATGTGIMYTRRDLVHGGSCDGGYGTECKMFDTNQMTWAEAGSGAYPSFVSTANLVESPSCYGANKQYGCVKMPPPDYDAPFLLMLTLLTVGGACLIIGGGMNVFNSGSIKMTS
jgi:hypothetical protein